jgi:uridine kinase
MSDEIREVPRRETVQVYLPHGRILEGPADSQVQVFLSAVDTEAPIVGAVVNGALRELTYPIEIDARVRPITMAEADGMRIYRRSLTFLLAAAFESC